MPVLSGTVSYLVPRLADVCSNEFLLHTKIIHNSFFWLCCSFSFYRFSFIFLPAVSSSLSAGTSLVIHHRRAVVTDEHAHTPQSHTCTHSCLSSYLCEGIHLFSLLISSRSQTPCLNPDKTHFIPSL